MKTQMEYFSPSELLEESETDAGFYSTDSPRRLQVQQGGDGGAAEGAEHPELFSLRWTLQTLAGSCSSSELPAEAADSIRAAVALGRSFILQEERVCVSGAQKEELLSVRSESRSRGDHTASLFVAFLCSGTSFHQLRAGMRPRPLPASVPAHRLAPPIGSIPEPTRSCLGQPVLRCDWPQPFRCVYRCLDLFFYFFFNAEGRSTRFSRSSSFSRSRSSRSYRSYRSWFSSSSSFSRSMSSRFSRSWFSRSSSFSRSRSSSSSRFPRSS